MFFTYSFIHYIKFFVFKFSAINTANTGFNFWIQRYTLPIKTSFCGQTGDPSRLPDFIRT